MELSNNDIRFLEALQNEQNLRIGSKGHKPNIIITNRGMLSDSLLELFGVKRTSQSFFAFGVYVSLAPAFPTSEAEDWQVKQY